MRQNLPNTGREFPFPIGRTLLSVTDLKGRITHVNPTFEDVSGYAAAELLGQPHNIVRHPDMPPETFRDMWATIKSGSPWSGLVKNRRKDGDHYWVQANVTPVFDGAVLAGFLSVRSRPERSAVDAAELLYRRLRSEAAAGRRVLGLSAGRVVRVDRWGRALRLLLPGARGRMLLSVTAAVVLVMGAQATLPLWMALAFAAVVVAGTASLIWRDTQGRLGRVVAQANRLASGDLSVQVDTGQEDSLGMLQRALAQMVVNLRTVVADVRSELDLLRSGIRDIVAGNHDLSARTEAQASSLEQTAASMEQIAGTVRNSAQSVGQGRHMAEQMLGLAAASQASLGGVDSAMQSISESSNKMGEIIHVIEGVAFQTNILALNAAVEAARAGESGRGFAVVASEVRALSLRTAGAAREIRQLITESADRVEVGGAQTSQALSRMGNAVHAIQQVTTALDELSVAATQQQSGMTQINSAVSHIDGITQQNAAMVEQLAASADGLRTQVDQVAWALRVLRLSEGEASLAQANVARAEP